MAEPPRCHNRKCQKPMTFLSEEHGSYVFGCYACGASRVITKPETVAAARAIAQQQRASTSEPTRRSYSFPKG